MEYYPNANKNNISLLNHSSSEEEAIKVFKGTGIKVTTEGHQMLSSTIGATSFTIYSTQSQRRF